MGKSGAKKRFFVIFLIFFVLAGVVVYRRYRDTHLDVLEFCLEGNRLRLPCTVEDIQMCGFQVNEITGECDQNEWGVGTLYITQDENGMVYEIYTDEVFCDLEIYGNIDMGFVLREQGKQGMKGWNKAMESLEKMYGKPQETDNKSKTYVKHKGEKEYAYVTLDEKEFFQISRIGIVAEKPSLSQ